MKEKFWSRNRQPIHAIHITDDKDIPTALPHDECTQHTPTAAQFYLFDDKAPFPDLMGGDRSNKSQDWNELMIFSVEPRLALVAIKVSGARTLWQLERENVFKSAMKEADNLIGENAADPRLRHKEAWDFFNNYLFDLLRL